jgi:hypothetical protein
MSFPLGGRDVSHRDATHYNTTPLVLRPPWPPRQDMVTVLRRRRADALSRVLSPKHCLAEDEPSREPAVHERCAEVRSKMLGVLYRI